MRRASTCRSCLCQSCSPLAPAPGLLLRRPPTHLMLSGGRCRYVPPHLSCALSAQTDFPAVNSIIWSLCFVANMCLAHEPEHIFQAADLASFALAGARAEAVERCNKRPAGRTADTLHVAGPPPDCPAAGPSSTLRRLEPELHQSCAIHCDWIYHL